MAAFVGYTMPSYVFNWHHLRLIEKLEAFARGEILRLIVKAPPRYGKSELVSRRLPSYILGLDPTQRIIATSYSQELSSAMNADVQKIMASQEYAELFPESWLGQKPTTVTIPKRNSYTFDIPNNTGYYVGVGAGER